MPSRVIMPTIDGTQVFKSVPFFQELDGKFFPSLREIEENEIATSNKIYELLKDTSDYCKSAVIQQYNELYIWNDNVYDFKDILAPILAVGYDERGLPILTMPHFQLAKKDTNFYTYTDEEIYILWGRLSVKYNYTFQQLKDFLEKIDDLCDWYGLRRDDIIYNLSNVGYNKEYGFRIIDYGLAEEFDGERYRLIF